MARLRTITKSTINSPFGNWTGTSFHWWEIEWENEEVYGGVFLYGLGVTGRHLLVLEKIGLAWYSRVYILGGARFPFRGCRACRGPWGFNWWNKLSFNIPCLLLEIIPALDHFFGWWPGWWVGGGLSVFISNAVSTWPASTWYYAQNTLCWGSWMWHGLIVPMPERMSE